MAGGYLGNIYNTPTNNLQPQIGVYDTQTEKFTDKSGMIGLYILLMLIAAIVLYGVIKYVTKL